MVQFIHGLGGNETAWRKVANQLRDDYLIDRQVIDYARSQNLDLADASDKVEEELWDPDVQLAQEGVVDAGRTFAVGHSMGGLVARDVLREHQRLNDSRTSWDFQGLVTFGTPHDGARIIRQIDELLTVFQRGCTALIAGPAADTTFNALDRAPFLIRWGGLAAGLPTNVASVSRRLCENSALKAGGTFVAAATFAREAGNDISDVAPYIDELNAFPLPAGFPAYNVVGIEEEPVSLRVISSLRSDVSNQDVYSADEDDDLVNTIQTKIAL